MSHFMITSSLMAALAAPALAQSSSWEIDPSHSSAQFSVRHMMVSNVRGEFTKISGTLNLDEKEITRSSVQVAIDATTINTREPERDKHLKSADFLDVTKYPVLTFVSKKLERSGEGRLKLTGDLTIHGVTKEVVFDLEGPTPEAKDPWGNIRRGVSASARINRQDFGLMWNTTLETGGILVGEEVGITLDIELIKKSAAPSGGR